MNERLIFFIHHMNLYLDKLLEQGGDPIITLPNQTITER